MTVRLATAADNALGARLLQEFTDQVGGLGSVVVDPVRVGRRIQRWPCVQAVDDVAGVYCELKVREKERTAEFSAAFPRGASRGLIGPVFAKCAREAVRLLLRGPLGGVGPLRRYTLADVRAWKVWGEFLHGQTAARVPDGGREIAQSWVDYFTAAGKPIAMELRGSLWIPSMALGDLADHGA